MSTEEATYSFQLTGYEGATYSFQLATQQPYQ